MTAEEIRITIIVSAISGLLTSILATTIVLVIQGIRKRKRFWTQYNFWNELTGIGYYKYGKSSNPHINVYSTKVSRKTSTIEIRCKYRADYQDTDKNGKIIYPFKKRTDKEHIVFVFELDSQISSHGRGYWYYVDAETGKDKEGGDNDNVGYGVFDFILDKFRSRIVIDGHFVKKRSIQLGGISYVAVILKLQASVAPNF